ncbi:hypothetical protein M9H77_25495 [Catharanthus roseus]|uniref:Uncharacterized protein n=1 Tax=Catharanthus roseus TaxID=4058 RepID=A0ACC0A9Q6_CATRO|nr:hypothetical protein M9H77_25495 [Catharanthus roseus]
MKIRLTLLPVPEIRIGDLTITLYSVSVVIPSKLDSMQIKTSITCIRYMLSLCKLTHHTPGIVILHYLITNEWDLCLPQGVSGQLAAVKRCAPYSIKRSKRVGLNICHQLRPQYRDM